MKPDPVRRDPTIYPFTIEITTRFGDMDVNHHINNVAFARYFEEARVKFNHNGILLGGGHRLPDVMPYRTIVAAVSIAYLVEGAYEPPVQVGVGISRIGRSSFDMGAACFQDGRCLAVSDAVIALKGSDGEAMPDSLRERLASRALTIGLKPAG